MIAKFHSAPGHSMETTLTINIPPVNSVRGVRSEREREKERLKDVEWERHKEVKEQEKDKERKLKEKERERERERDKEQERERLMLEQDRALKGQVERSVSYKDKFQRMREKYEKVTAAHEAHQRDLESLNAKLKKLQSENDLLLDAVYAADAPLYERYFPSQPGTSSPPLDISMALPAPNSLPSNSQLLPPRLPDLPGPSQSVSSSHYSPLSMAPPRSMAPPISVVSSSSTSRAGPADLPTLPPPLPTMPLPSASATSMPPPLSVASNGIAIGNGSSTTRGHSRRPSSTSSTRTLRRRNDVIISPEDIVADAPEANTNQTSVPVEMAKEQDIPYSSPTLNGNATNASSRPDTPISNVIEQASAVKHSPEHSPDEHESENDADHRSDPVTGGAPSGSEADTVPRADEEKMDVDEEA